MSRWIDRYCLVAGTVDSLTGAALVPAPLFTVSLFGVTAVPGDPVFLRFVGVFVGAVGLSYLYPRTLDPALRAARRTALRQTVVLEITALVRLAVALFVTATVAAGGLSLPWLTVAATDLSLALVQLALLRGLPGLGERPSMKDSPS